MPAIPDGDDVAFASVAEYVLRTGGAMPTGQDFAQLEAALDDVSALIRARLRAAGAPLTYSPPADAARAVTIRVARLAMTNPGGYRSRSIGSYSETLGERGGLEVTDDDIALLLPPSPGRGRRPVTASIPVADAGLRDPDWSGADWVPRRPREPHWNGRFW